MNDAPSLDARTVTEIAEIHRLLAEAYIHYFEGSDGYCKSSEGAVSLHFPPFFWQDDEMPRPSVSVYSYVFGRGRHHDFDNATDALEEVRRWHTDEMARTYCPRCQEPTEKPVGQPHGSGFGCCPGDPCDDAPCNEEKL